MPTAAGEKTLRKELRAAERKVASYEKLLSLINVELTKVIAALDQEREELLAFLVSEGINAPESGKTKKKRKRKEVVESAPTGSE